jgi:hypothetical protein
MNRHPITWIALVSVLSVQVLCAASTSQRAQVEIVGERLSGQADVAPVNVDIVEYSEGCFATRIDLPLCNRNRRIRFRYSAEPDWRDGSFTFKAQASGQVALILRGQDQEKRDKPPVLVIYDNVRVTGAEIKNGSFETLDNTGVPVSWKVFNEPKSEPPVDDQNRATILTSEAIDGKNCVRVGYNSSLYQLITVEAEKPVTVSFFYRTVE